MNAPDKEILMRSNVEELLYNWVHWLRTRRFYAPKLPANILAMLQGDNRPSRGEPNAENDALCAAFNLVIAGAPDADRLPFLYVYLKAYRPAPIKTLAFELGIDRDTVYLRAHNAAPKFYAQALELKELNSKLQREVQGFVNDLTD